MNDKHEIAPRPVYSVSHEAWHWESSRFHEQSAEITISLASAEGGCEYDFEIVWGDGKHRSLPPTLTIYDDGFQALADPRFAPFFTALASQPRSELSPPEIVQLLAACGFEDVTKRERPT